MKRTSVRMTMTYLIADARERAVIPFIETEFKDYAYIVKQVTTADYLICRASGSGASGSSGAVEADRREEGEAVEAAPAQAQGAVVLAAIERKSHEDFAASFKDGRHDNIKKLLALRGGTGCKLFYFVEGPLNGPLAGPPSWAPLSGPLNGPSSYRRHSVRKHPRRDDDDDGVGRDLRRPDRESCALCEASG